MTVIGLTLKVWSQHWIGPVLHWLTVVTVGAGAVTVTVTVGVTPQGVATARTGSARSAVNLEALKIIVVMTERSCLF